MRINNTPELAVSPLRASALRVLEAGFAAIDTGTAVRRAVRLTGEILRVQDQSFDLSGVGRLVLVGVGKCALDAAAVLEDILGERVSDGFVIDVRPGTLRKLEVVSGDHPFPTAKNVDATRRLLAKLEGLTEKDLVLAVISGGGSTLLCQPQNHTCLEEGDLLSCLFQSGFDIRAVNTVRKHTSLARGGRLARRAYPARVVSLIFSDVPQDDLSLVASGPTFRDTTTAADARAILALCPAARVLREPDLLETPKEEKYFERVSNILLVSNRLALSAMAAAASAEGFTSEVATAEFKGEAGTLGGDMAREMNSRPPRTALLYGGESTVTTPALLGGGRNQELALAALESLPPGTLLAAVDSDGRDNGDYAGALCDALTLAKARAAGLLPSEYLARHDSRAFFESVGDYIRTGPVGSNVSDLVLVLKA